MLHSVPEALGSVLQCFENCFSARVGKTFAQLCVATLASRSKKTVTGLLRSSGEKVPTGSCKWHHFFLRRNYSLWNLSRVLSKEVVKRCVGAIGPISVAVDDTVLERPGRKVFGKDKHRDAVRSSHSHTAFVWGLKWVVVAIAVRMPFSERYWSLPVMAALYRSPKWNKNHGKRHRTPSEIAMPLLYRFSKWFPGREIMVIGDSGFGPHKCARFFSGQQRLTLISKVTGKCALYTAPVQKKGRRGPKRIIGEKMPSPIDIARSGSPSSQAEVDWYGGKKRHIEYFVGTGYWYRIGQGKVLIKWVYVRDKTGSHRDEVIYSTDANMSATDIVNSFVKRWSIETTFQELKEHHKLSSTRCWSEKPVLRIHPFLFCTYALTFLTYLRLPSHEKKIRVKWFGKRAVTYADIVSSVRRHIWAKTLFSTPRKKGAVENLSKAKQTSILNALSLAS